jgi:hypothetical protein
MKTTVVNVSREKCDVYIGRPGPFGNPFVIGKNGTRQEVIFAYSRYFSLRVETDEAFKAKAVTLRGRILGCHCKPLPCHGDVIVEWLESEEKDTIKT